MTYTLSRTLARPYDTVVPEVRSALADNGFGVLTEIDVKATMKEKLDLDVAQQVILGACRPQLAHRAMDIDASVATLLPCNVVVRAVDDTTTVVEAFDPAAMTQLAGDAFREVADEVRERLSATLSALPEEN